MGMPPAANLEQTDWRWYADDASGDPSVALAGENVKPTLAGDANYTVIRLRAVIQENGGAADAGSFDIQWSEDGGTTWNTLDAGSVGDEHLRYGDGGGVNNTTIAANLISTGGALGKYHEATGNSETIGASTDHEVDVAIYTRVFLPDTDYQFRLVINGTAVPVKSGSSAIQLRGSTAASREVDGIKHTVADLTTEQDNDINTMAWGHGNRGFFDGTRHWVFWNSAANTIAYKYTSDLDTAYNATPATVSFTAGPNAPEDFNVDFVNISGTLYVILVVRDTATSIRFKRGTISGTTITWDSTERTLTTVDDAMDGPPGLCIDAGNKWWIGGKGSTTSQEIWVRQSSNSLDNATYYTFGSTAVASESGIEGTSVFEGVELRPLGTDEILVVYYDAGNSNLRARKAPSTGGLNAAVTLNASTDSHDVDWNVSRSDGTYIYVVHGDATTNAYSWALRVYTISSDTWAAGTSPSVTKSGSDATANDGLAVHVGDDGNIYAVGSFAPSNRDTRLKYKKYTGGTSGTWDGSLSDLTQTTTTFIGNADGTGYSLDSANLIVFRETGDTTATGTFRVLEFFHTTTAAAATVYPPYPPPQRRQVRM